MCCDVCLQGKWRVQHQQALQSNELIDFNFRAVLSPPDVLKLSSIAEHKLVTVLLVQRRHSPTTTLPAPFLHRSSPACSICLPETGCYLGNAVFKCVKSLWLDGCFLCVGVFCEAQNTPVPDRDGAKQIKSRACVSVSECVCGGVTEDAE